MQCRRDNSAILLSHFLLHLCSGSEFRHVIIYPKSVILCYLRSVCAWKACICEISRKACKNRSGHAHTQNTYVDEYHRDQKGLCKTRLFPHFLAGMLASVFPVLHSSVRLRGRQSATGAYFAGWLYWRCRIESRFRIFCPSKLSPLQPLQRRLRCAAACTKIDAGNRTAYTAKWKETAS